MSVCNHKRKAHRFCRDFTEKQGELVLDEDSGEAVRGCVNCVKVFAIDGGN